MNFLVFAQVFLITNSEPKWSSYLCPQKVRDPKENYFSTTNGKHTNGEKTVYQLKL